MAVSVDIDKEGVKAPFFARLQGERLEVRRKGCRGRDETGVIRRESHSCEPQESSSSEGDHGPPLTQSPGVYTTKGLARLACFARATKRPGKARILMGSPPGAK